ncbi:hypothetical protein KSP40_PGU016724 [Platanthera guangdongensis]|uniref:Uncharacterized protein n=1 Tax=Platanthera guangdongensis TaxID=2320717 RepID=A0ABR2LEM1_9ASPA
MAEIYTKPFDSVQDAIILFEERIDKNKNMSSNKDEKEGEYSKDFTNFRLLLEAKEREKELAFSEFAASHENPDEMVNWIKLYKAETNKYKEKFRKVQELFFEFEKGGYSFRSLSNLKQQFSAADEYRSDAQIQGETMNTVSIVNKTRQDLSLPPMEAKSLQSQKPFDIMEDLESQFLKEVIVSEYLHMELKQSKEAHAISSKSALSIVKELDLVKSEAEKMKLINSDRANYIDVIEKQRKRMTEELKISAKKMSGMNSQNEVLVNKIQRMQEEMSRSIKSELEMEANVHKFLIEKSEMADVLKSKADDEGYEVDRLSAELEDKNAEISELKHRLEEASRRAEMAEKAKFAVEDQLRLWREQKRLRRAASEALKEYAAKNPEATRQHKKPLKRTFSKPELHCVPSALPKRSVSVHDGRQSEYVPLANFLRIKFKPS